MPFTVLTADFISSTRWPEHALGRAFAQLETSASEVQRWPETTLLLSRRGGDGWQMAYQSPYAPLRLTLFLAAHLMSQDSAFRMRLALAQDPGDLPENPDLNAATGASFVASGRLLEAIGPRDPIWCPATDGPAQAVFALAAQIAAGWTQIQAQTLAPMLSPAPGPRADLAKTLGKTRQSVDRALHGAGYPALMAAITALEAAPDPADADPY